MRKQLWGIIGLALLCLPARAQTPSVFTPEPAEVILSEAESPLKDLTPTDLPEAHAGEEESAPGLTFAAELLVLTPRSSSLDFALVDAKNDLIPAGRMQSLNYRIDAGFRAGLAYRTARGWDFGFAYSYFQSEDSFGIAAPAGALLYPTLTRPGLINQSRVASANAKLTINTYDIIVGRTWEPAEDLQLRFYGGLRFATIRTRLECLYDGRDADTALADTKSDFGGVGPMFGAEGSLNVGSGFGLFGKANGGLLTGTQRARIFEYNNGGGTLYTDFRDRYAHVVPYLQLGVGMEYRYNGVFLRAGYEVTNWFQVVDRPVFLNDFAEGKLTRRVTNLALDGLFLQAGFRY